MIHFFDGFNWPVDSRAPTNIMGDIVSNLPPSVFIVPDSRGNASNMGENGFRFKVKGTSTTRIGFGLVSRNTLKFIEGRLVAGGCFSADVDSIGNHLGFLLCYPGDTPPLYHGSSSVMNVAPSRIPSLWVNRTEVSLRQATTVSPTFAHGLLAQRSLTGLSSAVRHWYEVVYDAIRNVVEIFIDDVLVLSYDHTFSEVELSAEYVLVPQAVAVGDNSIAVHVVYAGTERLGPCKVIAKYADSDVNVPAAFGEGPHHPKLNGGFDVGNPSQLTTKENALAEFGLNGEEIQGEVKAVAVFGRYSTTNRSAYETEAKNKFGLRLPQGLWLSEPADIPSPVQVPLKIEYPVLEVNPLTGQPFTAEDVNNMNLAIDISVTNKF